ncbi:hypothetical protein QJQ45_003775 [Haematococcus lacustris]|nr:hypothetical protein QJQ45_003775 [Haematococcus lacustris]
MLAAHPDLRARLKVVPRYLSDTNMVDHVGKQLQTAISNMLTFLFAGRLKKSVSLAGAKVLVGTEEHQRRFGVRGLGGGHLPAWSKRQCTSVRRMVCSMDVSWLLEEGGMLVTPAMEAEAALQCGLLGLEEGEQEALRRLPTGRVVMVDEFRTSRVSSANNTPSENLPDTLPESFKFYDRDVSAVLNIRRYAVGPGPRPAELCCATRVAAQPGQSQANQARCG